MENQFNIEKNLKITTRGFPRHATIGVLFTFFFGKMTIIPSIFSDDQK